jgi:hypothetical protein
VAFLNHFLTVGRHGVNVCRTNITIRQFPLPPLFYLGRCCPGIPHRRFVLRIPPGVFCTSRCVLHRRGVFAPACFLRIFPGVFCTDGVFCIFSGRVLHRRGVLNQHAFYAFFRACFAPTVRFTFFAGEFCTGGAFCGSPGIFLAVCAFYGFWRGVPHSRGVSRHGVFCPRACDTAQACAPCRCVTHTRGIWR